LGSGAEREVRALMVRMPPHRALWFAEAMDRITRVSAALASSDEWSVAEGSFAWALQSAASATSDREAAVAVEQQGVASRQRLRMAAVLRQRTVLSDPQLVAVVDAAGAVAGGGAGPLTTRGRCWRQSAEMRRQPGWRSAR
jgi:hypothetical protein